MSIPLFVALWTGLTCTAVASLSWSLGRRLARRDHEIEQVIISLKDREQKQADDCEPSSPYRTSASSDDEPTATEVKPKSEPKRGVADDCPRCGARKHYPEINKPGIPDPTPCNGCDAWDAFHLHQECKRCGAKWVRLHDEDDSDEVYV